MILTTDNDTDKVLLTDYVETNDVLSYGSKYDTS